MKNVRVKKIELLSILKTNKQLHIEEYKKAETEFREAGIEALEEKLSEFQSENKDLALNLHIPLSPPNCHEDNYDDAIGMLEVSCDDVIELDEHEAQNLLLNNWSWSGELGHTRAMYSRFLGKN